MSFIKDIKNGISGVRGIKSGKYELVQSEENRKKAQIKANNNSISLKAAIKKPFLTDKQ